MQHTSRDICATCTGRLEEHRERKCLQQFTSKSGNWWRRSKVSTYRVFFSTTIQHYRQTPHPLRRNYGEQRPANLLFNLIRYTHFPVTPISQQDTRILASPFLHLTLEPSINASISTHGLGYFYCFALSISASTLPVQEAHDNTGYVVTALPLVGLLQELLCSFFRVLNGSGQGDSFLHDKHCKWVVLSTRNTLRDHQIFWCFAFSSNYLIRDHIPQPITCKDEKLKCVIDNFLLWPTKALQNTSIEFYLVNINDKRHPKNMTKWKQYFFRIENDLYCQFLWSQK